MFSFFRWLGKVTCFSQMFKDLLSFLLHIIKDLWLCEWSWNLRAYQDRNIKPGTGSPFWSTLVVKMWNQGATRPHFEYDIGSCIIYILLLYPHLWSGITKPKGISLFIELFKVIRTFLDESVKFWHSGCAKCTFILIIDMFYGYWYGNPWAISTVYCFVKYM